MVRGCEHAHGVHGVRIVGPERPFGAFEGAAAVRDGVLGLARGQVGARQVPPGGQRLPVVRSLAALALEQRGQGRPRRVLVPPGGLISGRQAVLDGEDVHGAAVALPGGKRRLEDGDRLGGLARAQQRVAELGLGGGRIPLAPGRIGWELTVQGLFTRTFFNPVTDTSACRGIAVEATLRSYGRPSMKISREGSRREYGQLWIKVRTPATPASRLSGTSAGGYSSPVYRAPRFRGL